MVVLILAEPFVIHTVLTHHADPNFRVGDVVLNALLLAGIGTLIVRAWVRRGLRAAGPFGLAAQIVLIAVFTVFLGLAINQLG